MAPCGLKMIRMGDHSPNSTVFAIHVIQSYPWKKVFVRNVLDILWVLLESLGTQEYDYVRVGSLLSQHWSTITTDHERP